MHDAREDSNIASLVWFIDINTILTRDSNRTWTRLQCLPEGWQCQCFRGLHGLCKLCTRPNSCQDCWRQRPICYLYAQRYWYRFSMFALNFQPHGPIVAILSWLFDSQVLSLFQMDHVFLTNLYTYCCVLQTFLQFSCNKNLQPK